MIGWLREHFGLAVWAANFDAFGGITLICLDVDWGFDGEDFAYIAVSGGLLGLCAGLSFWPYGKYDETDGAGA